MVVSLHACDIATDMAIHAGLKADAQYIVLAPCCHKQIRKQIELRNGILKHGILLERQAEIVTDAIRALVLEDKGYKPRYLNLSPLSIPPKHHDHCKNQSPTPCRPGNQRHKGNVWHQVPLP